MTLPALRAQIEKVDAEIVRLLNTRTRLCIEVGKLKRKLRRPAFTPEREEFLLRHLETKRGRGPLPAPDLRAIYREIFSSSRARQEPVVVGYLRDAHGTSLLAAWYRFGAGETYRGSASWAELCRALRGKKTDVALCSAASLAGALGREKSLPVAGLRICGEVRLPGQPPAAAHFFLIERGDPAEETAAPADGVEPRELFFASLSPAAVRRARRAAALHPAGRGRYLIEAGPECPKEWLPSQAIRLGTFFTSEVP